MKLDDEQREELRRILKELEAAQLEVLHTETEVIDRGSDRIDTASTDLARFLTRN